MKKSVSIKDLEVFFAEVQKNPDIFSPQIEGWSIWPMVKNLLFSRVLDRILTGSAEVFSKRVNDEKFALARQIREFILGNIEWVYLSRTFKSTHRRPIVMTFGYGEVKYKCEDGKYKNYFFDDIYTNKNRMFDMFFVEGTSGGKRVRDTVGPRHLRGEYLTLPGYLGARVLIKPSKEVRSETEKLLIILEKELESYPQVQSYVIDEFHSGSADRAIYRFFKQKKRVTPIINNVKPSVILVINSPGHCGIIAAAKEMGISVIEIQHGVAQYYHPAYCWPAWARDRKKQLPIPDRIFMWGKYWADKQLTGGFWKENEVLPFGNCRMDEFKKNFQNKKNRFKHKNSNDPVKLLFTTQSTTRKEAIPFLKNALKITTNKLIPLVLYVKVHPTEKNNTYLYKALQSNYPEKCIVYHPAERSLYQLISQVDIHLSVYSTSLYESIGIGTPTVVLDLKGKECMSDLLDSGVTKLCRFPEELIQYVHEAINNTTWWKRWVDDTMKAVDLFFTSHAIESIVNYLNEITKKSD